MSQIVSFALGCAVIGGLWWFDRRTAYKHFWGL